MNESVNIRDNTQHVVFYFIISSPPLEAGDPISLLDGPPVALKQDVAVVPLPCFKDFYIAKLAHRQQEHLACCIAGPSHSIESSEVGRLRSVKHELVFMSSAHS